MCGLPMAMLEIIPVCLDGEVTCNTSINDLATQIVSKKGVRDGDVVIVSQKVISKQQKDCLVKLDSVKPSLLAVGIAAEYQKDPRIVELILSQTRRIVRMGNKIIIVKTHHGFVCANAGVDESNVDLGYATLLPANPDESAYRLRLALQNTAKASIAVLISDTFGRPFRMGQTDSAIGVSGIDCIRDYSGDVDMKGRELRVSAAAVVDELCAAADLVKQKTSGCPIAIIRNFEFQMKTLDIMYNNDDDRGNTGIRTLLRPDNQDLFCGAIQ